MVLFSQQSFYSHSTILHSVRHGSVLSTMILFALYYSPLSSSWFCSLNNHSIRTLLFSTQFVMVLFSQQSFYSHSTILHSVHHGSVLSTIILFALYYSPLSSSWFCSLNNDSIRTILFSTQFVMVLFSQQSFYSHYTILHSVRHGSVLSTMILFALYYSPLSSSWFCSLNNDFIRTLLFSTQFVMVLFSQQSFYSHSTILHSVHHGSVLSTIILFALYYSPLSSSWFCSLNNDSIRTLLFSTQFVMVLFSQQSFYSHSTILHSVRHGSVL